MQILKEKGGILYNEEYINSLSKSEKQELIFNEFIKCSKDIEYYIKNYAFIRHAKKGIIKFEPFDFQWDIIIPISKALLKGREKDTYKEMINYKYKFDYKRYIERIEKNIELLKKVPEEIREQYTLWIDSNEWKATPDYIILKSRQTGISTTFQHIANWYANFHTNVVILVISKRDIEAKKFLNDIKIYYQLLPVYLKSKKLKDNDHELYISITGDKKDLSLIQSLAPSPDAGRGYSPNLVILDEFAMYKKAEELWTAISMSVSTGGIICIISTPKGVGNLYHKLWTEAVKEVRSTININKSIKDNNDNGKNINNNSNDNIKPLTTFRPYVIHWTQIPDEEFKRRGFKDSLEWYEFMRNKLRMEGGDKLVAQELDLEFLSSGDTVIPPDIINYLKSNNLIENKIDKYYKIDINDINDKIKLIIDLYGDNVNINYDNLKNIIHTIRHEIGNVILYRKPEKEEEYMIGVDVSEGLGKDYSVFYIMNIPKDRYEIPKLYGYYSSNKITPKKFAYLLFIVSIIYNNAYLNIERNSVGLGVIETLEDIYFKAKILNTYNPNKKDIDKFSRNEKGWKETSTTRKYLIDNFVDYVLNYKDIIEVNRNLVDELYTFIDTGKRYEHMNGFHDDNIFAYSLSLIGIKIFPLYIQFLETKNTDEINEIYDIPSDISLSSTLLKDKNNDLINMLYDKYEYNESKIIKEIKSKGITKGKNIKEYIEKKVMKELNINNTDEIEDLNLNHILSKSGVININEIENYNNVKNNKDNSHKGNYEHKYISKEIIPEESIIDDEDDYFVF